MPQLSKVLHTRCGSAHIQREPGKAPGKIRQKVRISETLVAPVCLRPLPMDDELQEE